MQCAAGSWPRPPCSSWLSCCRREVFDKLDADNSGGVSIEELSKGLIDMGYLVSQVRHVTCGQPSASGVIPGVSRDVFSFQLSLCREHCQTQCDCLSRTSSFILNCSPVHVSLPASKASQA